VVGGHSGASMPPAKLVENVSAIGVPCSGRPVIGSGFNILAITRWHDSKERKVLRRF
jgi:hypothetical protein